MDSAGIKIILDEMAKEAYLRAQPPTVDMFRTPGGPVFRWSTERTEDGIKIRCDHVPEFYAARVHEDH